MLTGPDRMHEEKFVLLMLSCNYQSVREKSRPIILLTEHREPGMSRCRSAHTIGPEQLPQPVLTRHDLVLQGVCGLRGLSMVTAWGREVGRV